MRCEEVYSKMIDYLDNNLEEGIRLEIEKHLGTCENCLDELRDTQKILNMISKEEMEKPDDSLRINFYQMLHSQIRRSNEGNTEVLWKPSAPWYNTIGFRIAAGFALLICGSFIGMLMDSRMNGSTASNELKQLQAEVSDLKKTAMFTLLQDESSSGRIQAVSYAGNFDTADENVIEVLVKTLNNDKNVNVRMAAAYALSKFTSQKYVCDSLVKSLSLQSDPILQVTLINILAERKEKSALRPVQEIIANKSTLKEVKTVAQNSLRAFI
jgi:hypothetical protein